MDEYQDERNFMKITSVFITHQLGFKNNKQESLHYQLVKMTITNAWISFSKLRLLQFFHCIIRSAGSERHI